MNTTNIAAGRVVSLHLHPIQPGDPLNEMEAIQVVEAKGIRDEPRYFGRTQSDTGQPSRRQVSLIEREQLADHAAALGLSSIVPGAARANIETSGIRLVELVGRQVEIGSAILRFESPRDPCAKMDAVCKGLRERMMNQRQGVLATVV